MDDHDVADAVAALDVEGAAPAAAAAVEVGGPVRRGAEAGQAARLAAVSGRGAAQEADSGRRVHFSGRHVHVALHSLAR